jgi:1,4-alpha-glucan branching enzyme
LFVPRVAPGARYKFAIVAADGSKLPDKADPLAKATEAPPATASVVADPIPYVWHDDAWMQTRAARHRADAAVSIY